MSELKNLSDAITSLNKSVSNFPIGAISLNDFKPIEEKIKNTRENLKHLNARLLLLKTHQQFQKASEPEDDLKDTITSLHEATGNSLINDKALRLCLHSYSIQRILEKNEGNDDMQKKVDTCMTRLFSLNDDILLLQNAIEEALQKQLDLKIQCQNLLYEYRKFLTEQQEIRDKKLAAANPEIARNKAHINKNLEKINIMKKLIVSFIASSNEMLFEEPILVKMLESHRELVNIDTIFKICQNNTEDENVNESTNTTMAK